jgi:hypothetical protein
MQGEGSVTGHMTSLDVECAVAAYFSWKQPELKGV